MQSDLLIPRLSQIIDRALDCRDSAVRLSDDATAQHLTTLIKRLPFARFYWALGTLHIDSPSGQHYAVTRAGCSCPNGTAGKKECWHWHLLNVLLDMFETDCDTADALADLAAQRELGQRLAAARAAYL